MSGTIRTDIHHETYRTDDRFVTDTTVITSLEAEINMLLEQRPPPAAPRVTVQAIAVMTPVLAWTSAVNKQLKSSTKLCAIGRTVSSGCQTSSESSYAAMPSR